MPFKVSSVDYDEVMAILEKHDMEEYQGEYAEVQDDTLLIKAVNEYFDQTRYDRAAVLGIDIYKYASLDETQQRLIPIVFKWLYQNAVKTTLKNEQYLFQGYAPSDFDAAFISTGDGGFQVFPTPIHAFVFAIYFQAYLKSFNGYACFPRIRHFLGETDLRYCLTVDPLFFFNGSYYGPAIINNARLLAKDRLNRFLIDSNCENWFAIRTHGIENLSNLSYERLAAISTFSTYDRAPLNKRNILFTFHALAEPRNSIRALNSLKIGMLQLKDRKIDVYSVYLQAMFRIAEGECPEEYDLVVSLGNLNVTGLGDA